MSLDPLFTPFEQLDAWLTALTAGAPLAVAIGIAAALGLRHAADPDHLVAVTSLMAAEHGRAGPAIRLGAWWGLGHCLTLIAVGLPLIVLKSDLPGWLQTGAERAVGVVILALAARVIWKWARGDYRLDAHAHAGSDVPDAERHRHLRRGAGGHRHREVRTPGGALAIGVLHGLAGSGAVAVLLLAALPGTLEAAAALAVFAPMSIISMAGLTGAFAWVLTRRAIEPVYRSVVIPALGLLGLAFGMSYAGIG